MEETTQETMPEYVKRQGITLELVRDNGLQTDRDEQPDAGRAWDHYAYVMRMHRPDASTSPDFDWREGIGHNPIVARSGYRTQSTLNRLTAKHLAERAPSVLDSLVSDAMSWFDARSFEDFAADFGYDPDSRKAEKIYHACGETYKWLRDFLGGHAELERVAYNVERM
jgi:hypothetical protein